MLSLDHKVDHAKFMHVDKGHVVKVTVKAVGEWRPSGLSSIAVQVSLWGNSCKVEPLSTSRYQAIVYFDEPTATLEFRVTPRSTGDLVLHLTLANNKGVILDGSIYDGIKVRDVVSA
jgi:hypothetical protein